MLKSQNNPTLMVEILAILSNLVIPNFDYKKLLSTYELMDFIEDWMIQILNMRDNNGKEDGIVENDDILLQLIIFLGNISKDENVPPMIAKTRILKLLVDSLMSIIQLIKLKKRMMK
jgi:hypothetical protein